MDLSIIFGVATNEQILTESESNVILIWIVR